MNNHLQDQAEKLESAVQQALDIAKKIGVDAAEVAMHKQQGLSVSSRMGELETVEFNRDGALGVCVYRHGAKGNASTSDLSPAAIAATVNAAAQIASQTTADPYNGLAEASSMARVKRDLDLYHPHEITPTEAAELAMASERAALAADKRVMATDGATFNSHEGINVYGNSHGFVQSFASSRHSLSCVVIGQDEQGMERDYDYTVGRKFSQLSAPETVGQQAALDTVARLGARKLKTCQVPVLFSADQAGGLIGHLVAAISGSSIYRNTSFLKGALGQSVFPKWLTIEENPHILGGLASAPFDGEGVATAPRLIVDQGDLATYLLTSYSSRRLNMANTAHAGGIYNWLVSRNGGDLSAMLQQLGTGLYVTELMGHGVNLVNGDYSRGAAGFWVENGVIQYPVHEITIAGNLKDIYARFVAIGSDTDVRHSLQTGPILIEQMKVAGN